jgi:hypothetical protein
MPSGDRRPAIVAALVEAQDRTRSVQAAKQEVLALFGVTWAVVEGIEREGMNNEWLPLDEPERAAAGGKSGGPTLALATRPCRPRSGMRKGPAGSPSDRRPLGRSRESPDRPR